MVNSSTINNQTTEDNLQNIFCDANIYFEQIYHCRAGYLWKITVERQSNWTEQERQGKFCRKTGIFCKYHVPLWYICLITQHIHLYLDIYICTLTYTFVPWHIHLYLDIYICTLTYTFVPWHIYLYLDIYICTLTYTFVPWHIHLHKKGVSWTWNTIIFIWKCIFGVLV